MKRFTAALTALMFAFSLAGCGNEVTAPEVSTPVETEAVTSSEEVRTSLTQVTSVSAEQTTTKKTKKKSETTTSTAVSEVITTEAAQPVQGNDAGNYYQPAPAQTAAPQPVQTAAAQTQPAAKPRTKSEHRTVEEALAAMTLHEKVCQMFIAAPEKFSGTGSFTLVDDNDRRIYDSYPIGGFIFFAANLCSPDQTKAMLGDLQDYALSKGTGLFLTVDEEGGRITRVSQKLGAPAVYDMSYYGYNGDYDGAYAVGDTIGTYLADYGFNVDFAPVADVNIDPNNELGSRIFSSDPNVVADMTAQVVKGLDKHNICSTLKHFPGLGAGNANTHYGTVTMQRSFDELSAVEFPAFKGGIDAGADFVMVGHQIVSAAGDGLPSDLSHTVVTDWLKGELGFEGLAITDSQSMGAITNVYGSAEASVLSVEAGIDIILMPYDLVGAINGVEEAVASGRISEERINESVTRILEKKYELGLL